MVGGITYQRLKDAGQFFCYSICDGAPARYYRPKGVPGLWIFGQPIELGGDGAGRARFFCVAWLTCPWSLQNLRMFIN